MTETRSETSSDGEDSPTLPITDEIHNTKTYRTLNEICERWRYQCPECDGHNIAVRTKLDTPKSHKESDDVNGLCDVFQYTNNVYVHDFRCDICGATFDKPYDKKRNERRLLRDEHSEIGGRR